MRKKLDKSIYDSDEASPGLLFWRSFYNWQRQIRMSLEPHDVTQAQYSIMAVLSYLSSDGSAVTQQDIAAALRMDKMMVSDVVKTLVRKKHILRKENVHDARAYALSLTVSGKTKLKQCVPLVEAVDETFFRAAGKEFSHFVQALKLLSADA